MKLLFEVLTMASNMGLQLEESSRLAETASLLAKTNSQAAVAVEDVHSKEILNLESEKNALAERLSALDAEYNEVISFADTRHSFLMI